MQVGVAPTSSQCVPVPHAVAQRSTHVGVPLASSQVSPAAHAGVHTGAGLRMHTLSSASHVSPAPHSWSLAHAFLDSLHRTGCAAPASGWSPRYLSLWDGDSLQGAVPLYRKAHSYGEYVFDWAWADAYARHGLSYYSFDKICVLLQLSLDDYLLARNALIKKDLVAFDGHLFQVLSLPPTPVRQPAEPLHSAQHMAQADPATIRQIIRNSLGADHD